MPAKRLVSNQRIISSNNGNKRTVVRKKTNLAVFKPNSAVANNQSNNKANVIVSKNARQNNSVVPGNKPKIKSGVQRPQRVVKKNNENTKVNITKSRSSRTRNSSIRRSVDQRLSKYHNKIRDLRNTGVGKTLVIVACGPSVNEVKDIEKLSNSKGVDVMLINKPYHKIKNAKYWVFCDNSQYKRNKKYFSEYNGMVFNTPAIRIEHRNQVIIKNLPGIGYSTDMLKGLHVGRSTTFAAMQIACHLNYDKIYVFGVDMCKVDGALHSYGVNPDVSPKERERRFKIEAKSYLHAGKKLSDDYRNKFTFCSSYLKWEFVNYFRKIDHKDAISEIISAQ